MRRFASLVILVLLCGLAFGSGSASAHQLKGNNGYTAVMHIDPDDDPTAGEPTVLNFLIGKDKGSYNQNDYDISVAISSDGQPTDHVVVAPAVFGNAGDGKADYTFPRLNVYTLTLTGHRKANPSDSFKMAFTVRVASQTATAKGDTSDVLILSAGSLVILGLAAYVAIVRGGRYDTTAGGAGARVK